MFKPILGAFVAAIAMFVTGFIFFATPLQFIATGPSLTPQAQAEMQAALARTLPETGTYAIPDASSQEGAIMYGKGPIATVHYNRGGFSPEDPGVIIKGFIHELIVCLMLAFALSALDRRVPDFASRARIVVLFSVASSALITLGEPIWFHHDWRNFILEFIGNATMLSVAGLIIARWFLPVAAEMPSPAVVQQPQEPGSGEKI